MVPPLMTCIFVEFSSVLFITGQASRGDLARGSERPVWDPSQLFWLPPLGLLGLTSSVCAREGRVGSVGRTLLRAKDPLLSRGVVLGVGTNLRKLPLLCMFEEGQREAGRLGSLCANTKLAKIRSEPLNSAGA